MRDKFSKIVLMAALMFALASTATAQTYNGPVTQIDDFANGRDTAITGDIWYNFAFSYFNDGYEEKDAFASISNGELGEAVNPDGYVEIKDIILYIKSYSAGWAQASIGLKAENNGISYDLAQCDGFAYKYKGSSHRFSLQSEKDGKQVTYNNEDSRNSPDAWTQVTAKANSFSRDTYDEAYTAGNTNIPLDLSKVKDIHWTVTPSPSDTVKGFLQIKDFECLGELVTEEKCTSDGNVWENGKCEKTTPIRISQTSSKWNILAQTANNAIMLENLPKNAKIDVYNLQGKHIFTSGKSLNRENLGSDNLKIGVQTKGMYIVKVGTQTIRAIVR